MVVISLHDLWHLSNKAFMYTGSRFLPFISALLMCGFFLCVFVPFPIVLGGAFNFKTLGHAHFLVHRLSDGHPYSQRNVQLSLLAAFLTSLGLIYAV